MKTLVLLSAMVLMVLPGMTQTREGVSKRRVASEESEKKEIKSKENTRREPAKMINNRSSRVETTSPRSNRKEEQSSGRRESVTRGASGTAINNSHSRNNSGYSHAYSNNIRVREVRVHRHIPAPDPIEVRRVKHVYRAPVRLEIYWSRRMHHDYMTIYPFYRNWHYTYGSRILAIPAYDAYQHEGYLRSVYGRVYEVYYAPESDLYYLYFGAPYPHHDFSIVMSRREARRFSSRPEWYFNGQYLMVTGIIAMYDGRPEIEVLRRSQLEKY